MLTESLIQMRENPLEVIDSHLGVVWFHGDQPGKQLLLNQQWNMSMLFLKWLIVKLSSWRTFLANIPLGMRIHCDCQSAVATKEWNNFHWVCEVRMKSSRSSHKTLGWNMKIWL